MSRLALLAAVLLVCGVAGASAQFVLPNLGGGMADPRLATGGFDATGPQSWPNLLGVDARVAKAQIEADAPGKQVFLVPSGNIVTMDFRTDRVRIFYDTTTNLVADVPRVG